MFSFSCNDSFKIICRRYIVEEKKYHWNTHKLLICLELRWLPWNDHLWKLLLISMIKSNNWFICNLLWSWRIFKTWKWQLIFSFLGHFDEKPKDEKWDERNISQFLKRILHAIAGLVFSISNFLLIKFLRKGIGAWKKTPTCANLALALKMRINN